MLVGEEGVHRDLANLSGRLSDAYCILLWPAVESEVYGTDLHASTVTSRHLRKRTRAGYTRCPNATADPSHHITTPLEQTIS